MNPSIFFVDPDQTAAPSVSILIQPYEQDTTVNLTSSNYPGLEVDVQKVLGQPSTFSVILPPNSPDPNNKIGLNPVGANISNTGNLNPPGNLQDLASLITPMSTVTIQMTRGSYTYLVFFGMVLSIKETENRGPDRVMRLIEISGVDMQYFLTNYAYFTLTWLGTANNVFENMGNIPGVILSQAGLSYGAPQAIASAFLQNVISPYLVNLTLPVNNQRYSFGQLLEARFGTFSSGTVNILFPFIPSFYNAEGAWWDKFTTFFPFPYYEMFFQTFDETDVTDPNEGNTGIPVLTYPEIESTTFTMGTRTFKNIFVSRELPFPRLQPVGAMPPYTYTLFMDNWNNLGEYRFQNGPTPFFESSMEFSAENARTFYMIDPSNIDLQFGGKNNSLSMFLLSQTAAMIDPINYSKYGYIPELSLIQWFFSKSTSTGGNSQTTLEQFGAVLLLTLGSYYVPLPLSARGMITLPLSPTILQGNKFTCQPFKNGGEWTFYIDSVNHHFEFGGRSRTTLQVSRGLPKEVYANTNGILAALLQGLVERSNNEYTLISNPVVAGQTGLTFATPSNVNNVFLNFLPALVQQGA